jgi:mannitol-1-phosphate/altronate dehydrogenase
VVERGPGHESARVIGSFVDYLYAPENPEAVLRVLADPRTRIVTLTITGAGYLPAAGSACRSIREVSGATRTQTVVRTRTATT